MFRAISRFICALPNAAQPVRSTSIIPFSLVIVTTPLTTDSLVPVTFPANKNQGVDHYVNLSDLQQVVGKYVDQYQLARRPAGRWLPLASSAFS